MHTNRWSLHILNELSFAKANFYGPHQFFNLKMCCFHQQVDQEERDISQIYRISVKEMKAIFTHGFPTRAGDRVGQSSLSF